MTYLTPGQAAKHPCPLARTFAKKTGENCEAGNCIMWRWQAIMANDPRMVSAIKAEVVYLVKKTGKSANVLHKQAVANVMKNPEERGVPTEPEQGWCGLAGKPVA